MTSTESAIRKILHIYRANPLALAKALDQLVGELIERRDRATEKDIALRTCRKTHPTGSDKCICFGCYEALLPQENEDEL